MKVRNGFVSNSSSSSFIVAFPVIPQSKDEIKELLFGSEAKFPHPYQDYSIPTDVIADAIWSDLKPPISKDEAVEEARGSLEGGPELNWTEHVSDADYDNYDLESKKYAELKIDEFVKENGSNIFMFEYSDHSDLGSAMEHGGIFSRIPHIVVNKH